MRKRHYYTDEQKAELLCNPYTARISDCKITFTLAFKQLVMNNIDKPGMTNAKVFELAGYRREHFTEKCMWYVIHSIRKEAASPEGLKEPKTVNRSTPRKKHSETEFKELQDRVNLLEQQIEFLKKSQALKKKKTSNPPASSS